MKDKLVLSIILFIVGGLLGCAGLGLSIFNKKYTKSNTLSSIAGIVVVGLYGLCIILLLSQVFIWFILYLVIGNGG